VMTFALLAHYHNTAHERCSKVDSRTLTCTIY
jgi:hypothetical protein